MSLVWSDDEDRERGYRDHHALTFHHHRVWRNDGGASIVEAGRALAAEHARDFVERVLARVAGGGVCVCALDTELLGHWWYEGPSGRAVVEETARQGLALTTLDDALDRVEPVGSPADLGVTSWGEGGDLRTWSAPAVADIAWRARAAELRLLRSPRPAGDRALRELLALQASDWAFIATRGLAGDYPLERVRGHAEAFEQAISGADGLTPALRSLAPVLQPGGAED